MNKSQILIEGISVETRIGVHSWEKEIDQQLLLDLALEIDISSSALSDSIDQALDYQQIAEYTVNFVEQSRYQLLEALAEALAAKILDEFPVRAICLTISKPGALSQAHNVALRIERGRD